MDIIDLATIQNQIRKRIQQNEKESLLLINKPVLLYRFKTINELDNFLFKNTVENMEVRIIISREEFHEVMSLREFPSGKYLFTLNLEEEGYKYKCYDLIII